MLRQPTFAIHDADAPLDVTLFDASHMPINSWLGVRNMSVHPPAGSICFVKVSGKQPTRYRITTRMSADPLRSLDPTSVLSSSFQSGGAIRRPCDWTNG